MYFCFLELKKKNNLILILDILEFLPDQLLQRGPSGTVSGFFFFPFRENKGKDNFLDLSQYTDWGLDHSEFAPQ